MKKTKNNNELINLILINLIIMVLLLFINIAFNNKFNLVTKDRNKNKRYSYNKINLLP